MQSLERNNKVRELREARGWTQKQFAQRMGVRQSAAAAMESPVRSLRLPTMRKIARALDVSVRDLLPAEIADSPPNIPPHSEKGEAE